MNFVGVSNMLMIKYLLCKEYNLYNCVSIINSTLKYEFKSKYLCVFTMNANRWCVVGIEEFKLLSKVVRFIKH